MTIICLFIKLITIIVIKQGLSWEYIGLDIDKSIPYAMINFRTIVYGMHNAPLLLSEEIEIMKTYFGFGVAPSMFPESCNIRKQTLTVEQAKEIIGGGVVSCLNPSHKASIDVMQSRFGVNVEIPQKAPTVIVQHGEQVLVMGVGGLPRLENRHEYTPEEVAGAKFSFALFTVSE